MRRGAVRVDITAMAEVGRLVEEATRRGAPVVLHQDETDVAVLSPLPRRRLRRRVQRGAEGTAEERAAALTATFGAWKGLVGAEQLRQELAASQGDDRPAPRL